MKGKIFTPDEANRMLPLVSRITDDIVATYARIQLALQAFETARASLDRAPTPGHDPETELAHRDRAVARLLHRFQRLIEEIEALGGTVKDYEKGCIDFYGEVNGRIVYLCWQRGEQTLAHWHGLDEGFAQRRPLAVAHAA
jgi:hypothetical protein